MSEMDQLRYATMLEADRRYPSPSIRDEVVLRTACGCEKMVSTYGSRSIQVTIQVGPRSTSWDPKEDAVYTIRTFVFEGQHDPHGRRIYEEQVYPQEPWEQRYKDLYNEVYGMDKGL